MWRFVLIVGCMLVGFSGCVDSIDWHTTLQGMRTYSEHKQTMEHNANTGKPLAAPSYP